MFVRALGLVAALVFIANAHASADHASWNADSPSFSCKAAHLSVVEARICDENTNLWNADRALAALYKEAFDNLDSEHRKALALQQRDWLKGRDRCIELDCIASAYDARSKQIWELILTDAKGRPASVLGSTPQDRIAYLRFLMNYFERDIDSRNKLRIGITLHRAQTIVHYLHKEVRGENAASSACVETGSDGGQIGPNNNDRLGFLFIDGKIQRIDVDMGVDITTPEGIHIGSTFDDAKRAYGDRAILSRKLDGSSVRSTGSQYFLTVYSPDHKPILVLETDKDKIWGMHVGNSKYFWNPDDREEPIAILPCEAIVGL